MTKRQYLLNVLQSYIDCLVALTSLNISTRQSQSDKIELIETKSHEIITLLAKSDDELSRVPDLYLQNTYIEIH